MHIAHKFARLGRSLYQKGAGSVDAKGNLVVKEVTSSGMEAIVEDSSSAPARFVVSMSSGRAACRILDGCLSCARIAMRNELMGQRSGRQSVDRRHSVARASFRIVLRIVGFLVATPIPIVGSGCCFCVKLASRHSRGGTRTAAAPLRLTSSSRLFRATHL